MAYSSTGLIEATDYNNFLNGSNQLNTVWSTGTGNAGYGQTALTTVAAAGTVTATQWATLITTLNSALTHQSASGSGISTTTAGSTITWLSTLATNINTSYTNRLNKTTNAGAVQSSFSPNYTAAATAAALTWTFTRTLTFASGDAARYFFNAGGYFNFVTTSVANNDGGLRTGDWVTLLGTYFGNFTGISANGATGRSGTGGTTVTNATTTGYWQSGTVAILLSSITATTYPYGGDYIQMKIRTNGIAGSGGTHADVGNIVYLDFTVYSGALKDAVGNKQINCTWNHRIDVYPPESTNLTTNSWGTVTVS